MIRLGRKPSSLKFGESAQFVAGLAPVNERDVVVRFQRRRQAPMFVGWALANARRSPDAASHPALRARVNAEGATTRAGLFATEAPVDPESTRTISSGLRV